MVSDRGSYLLGAAATTLLAVGLFALAVHFMNTALARQALTAASLKLIRCLTTTDGGCSSPPPNDDSRVEWFIQPLASRSLLWRNRSRFTGRVVAQEWELRGETSELLLTRLPPLTWEGSSLPLYVQRGALNRFERRTLHVEVQGTREREHAERQLRPRFEPSFPSFDEDYERQQDRMPFSTWTPLVASGNSSLQPAPFHFMLTELPGARIGSNSTISLDSPVIEVPQVPSDLPCFTRSGTPCVAATGEHDIHRFASIAIKAFAELSSPSSAEVRWGDFAQGAGLEVLVWSAAEVAHSRRSHGALPLRTATCLGGRDWTRLSPGRTENLNLWLRGPSGAHGGSAAICSGSRTSHAPIEVERGGAFQIRIRLSSRNGESSALVRLAYFMEQFEITEAQVRGSEPYTCERELALTRSDPIPQCPAHSICPAGCSTAGSASHFRSARRWPLTSRPSSSISIPPTP